jgi:tetrahydromethanopterin S-methyltransferase subunit F
MVAIAPTFMQPELAPYLRTGQLDGLLATVRDDAGYVGVRLRLEHGVLPSAFALLIGMLVALLILLRQLAMALPRLRGGSPAPEAPDE